MNRVRWIVPVLLSFCLLGASRASATQLSIALDVQGAGISLADGGVGLAGIGSGVRTITVDIGGPVQAALLYWSGRDRPCPESGEVCVIPHLPYEDQELTFDGQYVFGTIIGTEAELVTAGDQYNSIGYLADVTSIVQAKGTGSQTFAIADGNLTSNLEQLEGAGLLVIFTDLADPASYRLILFDGLDSAYGDAAIPGAARGTVPVTFSHGATTGARSASLRLFVGGASANADQIQISNHPTVKNQLDASDGTAWDTDAMLIEVPGGVASTTVALVSRSAGPAPDVLLWEVAALRIPTTSPEPPPEAMGCGAGFWKTSTAEWPVTGYSPGQTTGSLFSAAAAYPALASRSLLQTLQAAGSGGLTGAARTLLRAGVTAVLNASHPDIDFPRTQPQILAEVNAGLTSGSRSTMLALATELDLDNARPCPLY